MSFGWPLVLCGLSRKRRTEAHRGGQRGGLREQAPSGRRGERPHRHQPRQLLGLSLPASTCRARCFSSRSTVRRHDGPRGRPHTLRPAPTCVCPPALSLSRKWARQESAHAPQPLGAAADTWAAQRRSECQKTNPCVWWSWRRGTLKTVPSRDKLVKPTLENFITLI